MDKETEVQRSTHVHTARKWWCWDLNPVLPGSKSTLCPFPAGGDGINPGPANPYPGLVSHSH